MATTKRLRAAHAAKPKSEAPLPLAEAVEVLKKFPPTKFDQTVEIHMRLGIDPKQADQIIRGSLVLPHGIGKAKRVVVFAKGNLADDAKAAGLPGGQQARGDAEREDQHDEQDQAHHAAARAKDSIPAPEAVATAQQGQDQNHNKDSYDRTHGSLLPHEEYARPRGVPPPDMRMLSVPDQHNGSFVACAHTCPVRQGPFARGVCARFQLPSR